MTRTHGRRSRAVRRFVLSAAVAAVGAVGAVGAASVPVASAASFTAAPAVTTTVPLKKAQALYQSAYDPATGLLYVSDPMAAVVHVVYTSSATRASTGAAYVSRRGNTVLDPQVNAVVQKVDVSEAPVFGIGIDRRTHRVYGTSTIAEKFVVIQGSDGTADGGKARVSAVTSLGGHTRIVRADSDDGLAYVSRFTDSSVAVLDGRTGKLRKLFTGVADDEVPGATSLTGLDVNSEQDVIYTADGEGGAGGMGAVSVLDRRTGKVKQVLTSSEEWTTGITFDPVLDRVYAVNQGEAVPGGLGTVDTYDVDQKTGELTFVTSARIGSGPVAAGVDSHNGLVYVPNFSGTQGTTVAVIDAGTGALLRTIEAGDGALYPTVDPVSHTTYVTNRQGLTLSVINGPAPRPQNASGAAVALDETSAAPGGELTLSGTGFTAGQAISVKLDDVDPVIATYTADADGAFTGPLTVPATARGGVRHTVRVLGADDAATEAPARSLVAFVDVTGTTKETVVAASAPSLGFVPSLYQSAYDAGTGLLYVADPASGFVHVVYTAQATRESTGGRYVIPAEEEGGEPTDPAANTQVASISVTDAPVYGLGLNPKTHTLYGTSTIDEKLVLIDVATDRVRKIADLPGHTRDVSVDVKRNRVWVSATVANAALEVDGRTGRLIREVAVADEPVSPAGLVYSPEAKAVVVANLDGGENGNGSLTVIDARTGKVRQTIDGGAPGTTTVDYDAASLRVIATSQGADGAPGGVSTYAVNRRDGKLTLVAFTPTTAGALGTAVDGEGGYTYSTDFGAGGTVSLLAVQTGELIGTVKVGLKPLFTAVDPVSRNAYVTNQTEGTVSVISPGTLAAAG